VFNVLIVGSVLASLIVPTVADSSAAAAELAVVPSEKVTLQVETVNGSGCPAGTATVTSAADNTSFNVTYSDFVAEAGLGASLVDFRKNCQINVQVNVPKGFTFAIAQADYYGYAHLESGAIATQLASYYFTGEVPTAQTSHQFTGPFDGGWHATDKVAALIWAPCGAQANLNINAELRVAPLAATAAVTNYISMQRTKASARTVFNLSWKQC